MAVTGPNHRIWPKDRSQWLATINLGYTPQMRTLIATLIALMLFAATPVVTVLTTALTLLLGTAHAGRWKADDTLLPGGTFKDCRECPEMVVIPAGTFRMGNLSGDGGMDRWRNAKALASITICTGPIVELFV